MIGLIEPKFGYIAAWTGARSVEEATIAASDFSAA